MANVPVVVIGDPVIDKKDGTVAATEVTPGVGVVQVIEPAACEVRNWPTEPAVVGKLKLYEVKDDGGTIETVPDVPFKFI